MGGFNVKAFKLVLVLLLGLAVLAGCGGGSTTGPLNAPTNLVATPGAGQIVLNWKDNSTAEEGFRIFRRLEAETAFPTDAIGQVGADETTYTDSAISSAESYVYSVQAFSSAGEGELSSLSAPVKATLGEGKVTLIVDKAPSSSAKGVVTSNPAGINCISPVGGICSLDVDKGSKVTLTANPDEGSTPPSAFAGFSGACTTTSLTCEITMDAAKNVFVNFVAAKPGITVQISGDEGAGRVVDFTTVPGSPFINCSSTGPDCEEADYFKIGNTVVLYAEPNAGSRFVEWGGCDNVSDDRRDLNKIVTNARCDFTVDAVNVITATFLEIPDAPVVAFRPLNSGTEDLTYKVGTPLTLEWTVQNSPLDSLTLNGAALAANATSGGITLPATSGENIYRLEAKNANPTAGTATKTITTGEVPKIGEPAEQPEDDDPNTPPLPPIQPNPNGTYTITYTPEAVTPGGISRGDPSTYTYALTPPVPGATGPTETPAGSGKYVLTLPANTTPRKYLLEARNVFGTTPGGFGTGSDEFTIAAAPVVQIPNGTLTLVPPADVTGVYTLNWSATGTPPITYTLQENSSAPVDVTALNGTTTKDPAITTTYSLVASNSAGSDPTPAVVTITAPAPVLTATPTTPIASTDSVTLDWSTSVGTGPVTFTLNSSLDGTTFTPVVPAPTGTSVSLTPGVTTTYTITMTTPVDSITSAPVTVTVTPAVQAPVISFFPLGAPEDLTYAVNTPLTLEWSVQNGPLTSLKLNDGDLDVADRSEPVTLPGTATTTTHTLEAKNANPTAVSTTKPITTGLAPAITGFTATPQSDGSYSLTWTDPGTLPITYSLTPPGGGIISVPGSPFPLLAPVTPGSYTLNASNDYGLNPHESGSSSQTFEILAPSVPATITSFTANPPKVTIDPTGNLLEWVVAGTAPISVAIFEEPSTTAIFTGTGSGSFTVNPALATTYRLEASNGVGTPPTPVSLTIEN
jgi:Divergent InlB B-repeat domain